VNNPHGHIALCVAENKLVQEALAKRLMQPGTAYTAFSDSIAYCYNGFLGLPATREAVAYFLTHRFLNPTKTRGTSQMHVSPDCIALGSGCASLLNHLFFSLAEKGDAVLIPAPYHSAFEYDMQVRFLLAEKDCANAESTYAC
jgi:aspartate/methionine/tyrosine aminotransferase